MNALTTWLNQLAPHWGGTLLQAAWQSSLVALVLLGLVILLRRRPSPLRYWLLMIALLKFAIPPMLTLPTGLFSRMEPPAAVVMMTSIDSASLSVFMPTREKGLSEAAPNQVPIPNGTEPVMLAASQPSGSDRSTPVQPLAGVPARLHWLSWLMLVHLLGMNAVALWILMQMLALGRLTRKAVERLDGPVFELFASLGAQLGLRRLPRLVVLDSGIAPVAFGVLRPVVLLPRQLIEHLGPAQLRAVLAHELAHHRRRDPLAIVFQLLLLVVWWFNPVFWLLGRWVRKVREDCCDDLLLACELTTSDTYCETLVHTGRELTHALPAGAVLGFAESTHPLTRRLRRIMDANLHRSPHLSIFGLLSMIILAGILLPGVQGKLEDKGAPGIASGTHTKGKLRYEAVPKSKKIALGGTIWMNLKLINDGSTSVTLFWGDYAYEDQYRFDIEHAGAKIAPPAKRFMPPFSTLNPKHFVTIAPGGNAAYTLCLTSMPGANCQTYYFREPGSYTIRPSFQAIFVTRNSTNTPAGNEFHEIGRETLQASPVVVTIKDTPSPQDSRNFGSVKITGKVVDAEGNPIPGAKVTANVEILREHALSGPSKREIDQQTTDKNGTFVCQRLPDDVPRFFLTAKVPRFSVVQNQVVIQPPKKDYELQFTMDKNAVITVRGAVVDGQGQPLEGVRVTPVTPPTDYTYLETYTDRDGRFELLGVAPNPGNTIRCNFWRPGYIPKTDTTSKEVALNGEWRITVVKTEAMGVSRGQAFFTGGKPAARHFILLALKKPDGQEIWTSESKTDDQGAFGVLLPESGPFAATAILMEEVPIRDITPYGCWRTPVAEVAAGQTGLKLVFENRGRIDVTLETSNPLPPDRKYQVECTMLHATEMSRNVVVGVATVTPRQTITSFEALSPGTYSVEVKDVLAEPWKWSKTTQLPAASGDLRTSLTFQLPKMEFGQLRGRVFEPDGTTPIRDGSFSPGWGHFPFHDGTFALNEVPVGEATLTVRSPGYALTKVKGMVTPDAITDLGKIVLTSLEEATGWVEGRVLYDDGTPALGARMLPRIQTRPPFKIETVAADGSYRKQVRVGKINIGVSLDGLPRWPRTESLESPPIDRLLSKAHLWNDNIFATVDVKAGQTTKQDIIVPLKNLGKVRLNWLGAPQAQLIIRLAIETNGQIFTCGNPVYLGPDRNQPPFILENIPAGKRILLLRAGDYSGYQEMEVQAGDTTFTFDPANAGSVAGKGIFPAGIDPNRYRVELRPDSLIELDPIEELDGTLMTGPSHYYVAGSAIFSQDGRFRFPKVGPGHYALKIASPGTPIVHGIEAKAGQETTIEIPFKDEKAIDARK